MGLKRMINGKTTSSYITCNWQDRRTPEQKSIIVVNVKLLPEHQHLSCLNTSLHCIFDFNYNLIGYEFTGKKNEFVYLNKSGAV